MQELDATNAADFLRAQGLLKEPCPVRELAGGVSNIVLWVDAPTPFVLKQSRAQLRTVDPWFSDPERIFREVDAMRALRPVLGAAVPEILFEDRENFLFAMTAIPTDSAVWKARLLAGEADTAVAAEAGRLLGAIHSADRTSAREQFGDQTNFYQLRLEPFYLRLIKRAERGPQQNSPVLDAAVGEALDTLIAETTATRLALTHADFSPKNMLLHGGQLALVDYETVHFGDPAFDVGFFLAHLSLKTFYHAGRHEPFVHLIERFWNAYLAAAPTFMDANCTARGLRHLGGVMLVRIDGTSPVDYLTAAAQRDGARTYARSLLTGKAATWQASVAQLRQGAKVIA